ncbi:MAG: lamin tail domain-containing protein [Bacteroidales bacterium]|nr:lamin tail domain-containing protein [Bacteroidales bacterium]
MFNKTITTILISLFASNAYSQSLYINEVQNMNIDQHIDPSHNYGAWVELYNPTSNDIDITGYYLSDKKEKPKKTKLTYPMTVPAGGFLTLWFDNKDQYTPSQIDMSINADGASLYLSDKDGALVDSVQYPKGIGRTSYARKTDGGDELGLTYQTTPSASNNSSKFAEKRLKDPVIDQPSQIFESSLTFSVTVPDGATLRYTTDCSTPTETNGATATENTFTVSSTSIYRFCVFQDGKLPSKVITRTFILKDRDFSLPVVSVVSDAVNFYSAALGVFVKGVNGRPGNGQSDPCNWNMDWERPVNFEFLDENGVMQVNMETGLERCGGWSRAWQPYSFKIKANKRYEGQKSLVYQFFAAKPYLKHKTLQIRNGGNDNNCRIKDAALETIIATSGIDIDCQAYLPVCHYINGVYKGVINVREPNNKHYAYANYGYDDDELDQFEMSPDSGYVQKCGDKKAFNQLYELSKDASNPETYKKIRAMLDVDEYVNYMAATLFLGGDDWPQNNIKGFRPQTDDGRFRFVSFDLDFAFNTDDPLTRIENEQMHKFNEIPNKIENEFVTIFLNLLSNDSFRKQFIDTYCLIGGSVFEPTRSKKIITELCDKVNPMQSTETSMNMWEPAGPWTTANAMIGKITDERHKTMISKLRSFGRMKLSSTSPRSVILSSNISDGQIFVNDIPVPTNKFNGQLFEPIVLKASAPEGYRFAGWSTKKFKSVSLIKADAEWQYYDNGSLDGKSWKNNTTEPAMEKGKAPFGYGDDASVFATKLNYGGVASEKYLTYYFRTTVNLTEEPDASAQFQFEYSVDDGFVVYVNGTEAGRYHMPSGDVTFATTSSGYADKEPDRGAIKLNASLFKKGENIIAVEVHNTSKSSSDIYWSAKLDMLANDGYEVISTDEEIPMPSLSTVDLVAVYDEIPVAERDTKKSHPVVINEVSAGNSIYVNEFDKRNDWIELYNTTNEPIDVAGMYLTDNVEKPKKYQIEADANGVASTIIPAHGFLIVWCDKTDPESQLHASFKLDNEDDKYVILSAADQSWGDTLTYCAHNGDMSVGRFPDGSSNVYLMNKPTIDKPNLKNSYSRAYPFSSTPIRKLKINRSGDMALTFSDNTLHVRSEKSNNVVLNVYAADSKCVINKSLQLVNSRADVQVGRLGQGLYVARIIDSTGNVCTTKFIVK